MKRFRIFAIIFAAFQVGNGIERVNIGCRNEQGLLVDWFIVYKLPRNDSKSASDLQKGGVAYLYMDGSTDGRWKESAKSIDDTNQCVAYTMRQYYANVGNPHAFRLLYNDEWPDGKVSYSKAHAKGATVFDWASGFWLIHSVPKFPPKDVYGYPSSGHMYGQSMFCISFPYSMLKEISYQLYLYEPYIYDSALPVAMAALDPYLAKVVSGQTEKTGPFFRTTNISTVGGVQLTSFAKSKKWGKELYTDLVAPQFQRGLYAETWQNGEGDIGSNCTAAYRVYNVANVTLAPDSAFANHYDHSKWAVSNETVNESSRWSNSSGGRWVCIGDINRQLGQFTRGGGTMCIQKEDVWKTFRDSVTNYQNCPLIE